MPAGSRVVFPYIWSHKDDNTGLTESTDIEVVIESNTTYKQALLLVEEASLEYLKANGAVYLRQYFVEGIREIDGGIEFLLGT